MDEIIGHADISKVEDGLKGVVSLFDTNILPGNEYFVGGYYTRIKTHVENPITIVDSGRLVSMSIIPEHNVADENLKLGELDPMLKIETPRFWAGSTPFMVCAIR